MSDKGISHVTKSPFIIGVSGGTSAGKVSCKGIGLYAILCFLLSIKFLKNKVFLKAKLKKISCTCTNVGFTNND